MDDSDLYVVLRLCNIIAGIVMVSVFLERASRKKEREWGPGSQKVESLLAAWLAERRLELLEATPIEAPGVTDSNWRQRKFSITVQDAKGAKHQGVAVCGDSVTFLSGGVKVERKGPGKPGADVDFA